MSRAYASLLALAVLAACESPPGIGGSAPGKSTPVSYYECADGTKLDVRMTEDAALVRVNGGDEIQLPKVTSSGVKTVITNGKQTAEIDGSQLRWSLGRAEPIECKIK
jgi:hypothetical protein